MLNCAANAVFNAALRLALPEENRGAILGFISAASTGGCALSAVIFGVLGDLFPLYLVFIAGSILSIGPTLYLCGHKYTREFVTEHYKNPHFCGDFSFPALISFAGNDTMA